jgi:hypothetical protein
MNLNALNPISDINSVIKYVNDAAAGGAPISPETFYSKQLLDTIRIDQDQFIYYRYADAMPIQEKADKLMLRRWAPLQGHTVPLSEGVPPKSDKGSNEKYELEAFQYGRYMEFTDKVNFKIVDPMIAHYSKEYAIIAVETLDMLAREALLLAAQKYYAGGATSPDGLTFANGKPSMTDLRKIVLSMKKALVKPRSNGKFHVIGSAEFYYDMLDDTTVKNYMTINQTTKTMYDGGIAPLVPMFGMEFYETLVVPTSGEYVDESGNKRLKIWSGTVAVPDIHTSGGAGAEDPDLDETDAAEYSTRDGYVTDSRTGREASYVPEQDAWVLPATHKEFKMQHILVLGKDCLARTGLAGEDNAKMYVKPLGSTGVIDPIDQRQSIGFKINSVGFGSIRPEAIVDYICVPSQVNL